jgi:hypothetical protein
VLVCVIDPEVAAIETVDCPAGVVGVGFGESSLQPTMIPVAASASIKHNSPGNTRRRLHIPNETNGSSSADAIPATTAFCLSPGRRLAVPLAVWIVTVPVATAVGVTLNEAGANVHVAAAGSPLHASATEPLNPFVGATLTVAVVAPPTGIVAAPAELLNPYVAAAPVVVPFEMPASRPCN